MNIDYNRFWPQKDRAEALGFGLRPLIKRKNNHSGSTLGLVLFGLKYSMGDNAVWCKSHDEVDSELGIFEKWQKK
jgi:hypothetical protein